MIKLLKGLKLPSKTRRTLFEHHNIKIEIGSGGSF